MTVWPFVRLKLRLTANGLRGRPARIVLFVMGALVAGFFAIAGYSSFAVPGVLNSSFGAELTLPLGGAALVLGWLFLPLIFFGVDESLDPARFALLPLTRRTLIAGVFTAAMVGLPALATLAATAGMVDTAARLGGPAAALAQVVGVLLGLFLCVAVSRAVTSAFATALRSRRSRDLAAIMLALLAAAIGPLQLIALAGAQRADWDTVASVARVVAWTPLGAPYSIGLDVAAGHTWQIPLKLLIAVAAITALLWWWSRTIESAMVGTASAARRKTAPTTRNPVELLLFRRVPRTRFGALMSRELRYWWRDPKRRANLITFSMVSLFLPVSATVSAGSPASMSLLVGTLAALALANQFGFDGSAYAANITSGVPGRTELTSRTAAHAVYTLPVLLVGAVLVGVLSADPARIPSTLGLLLAAYGVGLGLVLPLSVRAAYALPESPNPFAMSSGGGATKGLLALAVLLAAVLVSLPVQLIALFIGPIWLWIGLPVGVAYGIAGFLIGSGVAADQLDRRMPELLATITPNR
ncbi:transporter [Paractinoplanes ferrugineus]|uniref:Transporter n=1 Tax=Paractinoplanes ferrugineus TaxID=113564 RepID=A0A919J1Z1_9ACTN|nr:ABC transporter permease [Actinoplanes ferrugineus]GIE11902.1 transporter [Actinoplanes ferrugineus]